MENLKVGGIFLVTCYDKYGNVLWYDKSKNLVVNTGLEHILDLIFKLDNVIANDDYYIGLIGASPVVVPSDTMTSHDGWEENTKYVIDGDPLDRPKYKKTRTGLYVNNEASRARFKLQETTILGGAFLTSSNSDDTGLLLAASSFENGDKLVNAGTFINVGYNFSISSV